MCCISVSTSERKSDCIPIGIQSLFVGSRREKDGRDHDLCAVWLHLRKHLVCLDSSQNILGCGYQRKRQCEKSEDGNPGTVNAFRYGGFWCGLITLCGDLLKGFIPVFLFASTHEEEIFFMPGALVLAAPVLGHAFPLFHRFRGGKGIAVSFGCLLGLMPFWRPFAILAGFFLLFSLIVVITPNFQRTLVTFLCSAFTMFLRFGVCGISLGFLFMTCIVCLRLHMSRELRMKMKIALGHSR